MAKTLGMELKYVLEVVIKIVNYIKTRPLKCRQFTLLCESMDAEHLTLLQHTEARWLFRGKVFCVFMS